MGRSDSSDSSDERKKKKDKSKKEKKEKSKKEKGKKDKKDSKAEKSDKGSKRQAADIAAPSGLLDEERLQPSGLLDGDDMPPPPGPRSEAERLAMRSRSRTEPPPNFFDDFDKGKGKGKGFGKGKGKGKDKGPPGPGGEGEGEVDENAPKEEPNFEASGLLGVEDNSKNGVALKFTIPAEARMPNLRWRIYIVTKQQEDKPKIVHIHRMAGVLFGKDRRVADIPTDHPTCSKQQAVLHHRLVNGAVKPYVLDLESTNGTFLNGKRLEPARYYEMRESDTLKFGLSSREFVLLHAGSANHIKIDPSKLMSDSE